MAYPPAAPTPPGARAPQPGSTVGQAIPLPPQYASLNTPTNPTAGIDKYVDDQYQKTGQIPPGFTDQNGHAVEQSPGFLSANPWIYPLIGAAIGLTGGAAAGALAGDAGGAAAAGTGADVGAVEGGASGLSDSALTGLGGGLPPLPSTTTAPLAGDLPTGAAVSPVSSNFVGPAVDAATSTTPSILNSAGQIANGLGVLSGGLAQGAQAQAGITNNYDRNAVSLYGDENTAANDQNLFDINSGYLANTNANTDLAQRKFALTAPDTRAGTAVRGDILANAQDVNISGLPSTIPVPTISGGLRPSMFSPATRELGNTISSQALSQQQAGDTFAPLPALPTYKPGPAPPTLTPLPNTNLATGLGTTSSILNLAKPVYNAISPFFQT